MKENKMTLILEAMPINESFARSTVASFCVQAGPTLEEISDIKTAVSEAVTNCIVHAYQKKNQGKIKIITKVKGSEIEIEIIDNGIGIENIEKAREPFFTTLPEDERSGMGFTVMESFMDSVSVIKNSSGGITVKLKKRLDNSPLQMGVCDNVIKRANFWFFK